MNYQRLHDAIIQDARTNPPIGYTESHHIVPRCMGGGNEVENRVRLTARQHFVVHRLLTKIYPNEPKLWYAFNMMFYETSKKMRFNDIEWVKSSTVSRTYEYLKQHRPPVSEYTRKKMSEAGQRKPKIFGRTPTSITRQKQSVSHLGVKLSEQHKQNIGLAGIGRKHSTETIAKLTYKAKIRYQGKSHPLLGVSRPKDIMLKTQAARVMKWQITTPENAILIVTNLAEYFRTIGVVRSKSIDKQYKLVKLGRLTPEEQLEYIKRYS